MRILILSQYFTPEVGATSTRVHEFAAGLAARRHEVHVVCEVPNHPQGVIHSGYRGRLVRRQRLDGFHGSWVWVRTTAAKNTFNRLAFYGSYLAMATGWGSLLPRPDVILASSPPLPVGLAASLLARRHLTPFVLDVRDLWPAAAIVVGELSSGPALAAAERLERFLYRDAAAITTVTRPFVDHIEAHGGTGKVELVQNGTTRFWLDAAELKPDPSGLDLPESDFIWTFAGNLGLAQGLETAVRAAALLGPGFRLLLLGDGAEKRALQDLAQDVAPGLVEFREQVPQEEAARILRSSDALLVSLDPHPGLAPFVPSKLFDFCAVSRPVVLAAAGEARRLVEQDGSALAVPPGNAQELAAAIRRIRASPALASSLVAAGRDFAEQNLREDGIGAVAELLDAVARRAGTRR